MEVVPRRPRSVKMRWALAGVAALLGPVLAGAAPDDGAIPSYRRLVEAESSRMYSPDMNTLVRSRDARLAGRAALALGRTKDPRAAAPLAAAVRSGGNVAVRALSVFAYGLLADRVALDVPLLTSALHDPEPAVRAAAVDAAQRVLTARTFQPRAAALVEPLTARLRDADPEVRGRAAAALVAARDPKLASVLLRAYTAERDRDVRVHIAWALRRGYAKAVPATAIRAGLRDADETTRIQWAAAAAAHGDASITPDLREVVRAGPWRVAEQASEAIRALAGSPPTIHLTAVPDGVVTPGPQPVDTSAPLPRPSALPSPKRPTAADVRLDLPLRPVTARLLDGPMAGPHPRVRLTTTQGTIVLRLYPEWAPVTAAAFLGLTDRGLLDGRRWFRIVPDFVVQTGDISAKNDGDGESPYTLPAEENPVQQRAGIIAMGMEYKNGLAERDSAGTEFYLTISPQFHLDRDFSVFGEIESGFEVLGRLLESDTIVRAERLADD